jgi:hypothetical protein
MTNFTGKARIAATMRGNRRTHGPLQLQMPNLVMLPAGNRPVSVTLQFLSPSGPVGTLGQDGGDKD